MCRNGFADPDSFGSLSMSGLQFVRGNLVRDILAPLMEWNYYPGMYGDYGNKDDALTKKDLGFLDEAAH